MRLFKQNLQKGFTLIELVIVIAIIAILAVGVIAALNPAEQSNRAADGKLKNTMSEFMSAIQRYYTTAGFMPFCSAAATNCSAATALINVAADTGGGASAGVITKLTANNEITGNFNNVTATDQKKIYATYVEASNTVRLCYLPLSQAGKADSVNKYTDDTGATACVAAPYTACYYCIIQ